MKRLSRALLLLTLQVILVVPTCQNDSARLATRSLELHWQETNIQPELLDQLLSDRHCQSSEQLFLSCLNSILTMAERYGLSANPTQLITHTLSFDSEKVRLEKWIGQFGHAIAAQNIWNQIKYKYSQQKGFAQTIATGINGFLSIYKDPHTYILPIAYYKSMARNSSRIPNMGFLTRRSGGTLLVKKVFSTSPAEMSGLKRGDLIIEINSLPIRHLTQIQINDILRSDSQPRLRLVIERNHIRRYIEIINRDSTYESVSSHIINQQLVGLLTIHRFAQGTCDAVKANVQKMLSKNIQGLIIDLRDNPGGQVEEAACATGLFFKKGTALFETRRLDDTTENVYEALDDQVYAGPLSVIINSSTASAAEMMAGAFKDLSRGLLVGEKTFGKGTFQDGKIWGKNKNIIFFETQGAYYFPSGWTPQISGIEPDLIVTETTSSIDNFSEASYYSPLKTTSSRFRLIHSPAQNHCLHSQTPFTDLDEAQLHQAKNALTCLSEL